MQEERHGEVLDLGNVRLLRRVVGLPFGVISSVFGCSGGYLVDDLQCTHAVLRYMGSFIFTSDFYIHIYIFLFR